MSPRSPRKTSSAPGALGYAGLAMTTSPSGPHTGDAARVRRERDLFERLLELGNRSEPGAFVRDALTLVVEVTRADRGYLEIRDGRDDRDGAGPDWSLSHGFSDDEVENLQQQISQGIIGEALATGETILTSSALSDERFMARESVQRRQIEAVLCAPLGGSGACGVVYLQGRRAAAGFEERDQRAAELFARHVAPLADRLLVRQRVASQDDATRALRARYDLGGLAGRSPSLAAALEQAMLAAPLDVTVLLTGPSGTGKTELARIIHRNSRRADGPFVELNCAALPTTLIESELFGARAGAHSEARRDQPGKVAAAQGGTLLLDEVSELPLEAQAKLLQLLQSRSYYPLGSTTALAADVRVVAASNADLEARVADAGFREDLFYRLNVLPVRMPALVERRGDIAVLARALLERAGERHGLPALALSDAAVHALETAEWPGNVRQLENAVEAAAIRAAAVQATEVAPAHVFPAAQGAGEGADDVLGYQEATRNFQRELLARTLRETDWNVSATARRLGLARSYVYELIASFGMKREPERARD